METLADLFAKLEREDRSDLLLARSTGSFEPVSSRSFVARARRCANALASLGVGRGDRVGLVCSNRPEWHVIDFACHLSGAILVPFFSTLTASQVGYVLAQSGCKVGFFEGPQQLAKLQRVRSQLVDLEAAVALETISPHAGGEPGAEDEPVGDRIDFEELLADASQSDQLPGPAGPDSIATIIFTSGTTGAPKGVMLSHGNLMFDVVASMEVLPCRSSDRALSVLPLCHIFQRTVDYTFFYSGAQIAYGVPDRLAEDYVLARPTVVAGVPRLFERFRSAVLEQVADSGAAKERIFNWAVGVGRRRAEHELSGAALRPGDGIRQLIADRLVLRKIRDAAGGRIHHFVSGGAALDPSLNWWFESMGLRLLQGYGLTETSPIISANPHGANRIGTVGKVLPGIDVEIAADGEILTRGPHVMLGYWNNPEATAEVIIDGWLHTGDIGTLDEDGYLSVTDRKKHLIVLSTGKNVAPQPLENALAQSRYVEQVAVVGDDRRFVAGLIVPQYSLLQTWAAARGKPTDAESLCADADVAALIRDEIDALQADFAPFERVREFRLLAAPFNIEDGTLTPTLKAVRKVVEHKYAALIDELYEERPR